MDYILLKWLAAAIILFIVIGWYFTRHLECNKKSHKYKVDMFTDIAEFFDKRYEKRKDAQKDVVKALRKFFEKYD